LKDLPFDEAPAGMLNLEHAASLTLVALGEEPSPHALFQLLSRGPARIAQLRSQDKSPGHTAHGGTMVAGDDANVVIFDPRMQWTASREHLASRASNTPYDGRAMTGKVRALVAKGALVVHEGLLV
jgi:dihydroorotase